VGVCDPTFCANDSFCNFGEICGVPADAGVTEDGGRARAQCYSDYDIDTRPYCSRCTSGGGVDTCGFGANYCIIDTRTASTYCGADCSEGPQCPRGYGCRDSRIVFTRWMCSPSLPCRADPNLPCQEDSDCRLGGSCVKAPGSTSGFCAGQCVLREGSAKRLKLTRRTARSSAASASSSRVSTTRRPSVVVTTTEQRTSRSARRDEATGFITTATDNTPTTAAPRTSWSRRVTASRSPGDDSI
jgi:hypothetical protein